MITVIVIAMKLKVIGTADSRIWERDLSILTSFSLVSCVSVTQDTLIITHVAETSTHVFLRERKWLIMFFLYEL